MGRKNQPFPQNPELCLILTINGHDSTTAVFPCIFCIFVFYDKQRECELVHLHSTDLICDQWITTALMSSSLGGSNSCANFVNDV